MSAGDGTILTCGTQNANVSQNGSGFEMVRPGSWVTSLNTLPGAATIKAGANVATETTMPNAAD